MKLIYTIEGTGTHSLMTIHGRQIPVLHCGDDVEFSQYDEILTTFRDPLRVGASWVNSIGTGLDDNPRQGIWKMWTKQWRNWAGVIPIATVYNTDELPIRENQHPDLMGTHKALDSGDMKFYSNLVPGRYIDFATEMVGRAYG